MILTVSGYYSESSDTSMSTTDLSSAISITPSDLKDSADSRLSTENSCGVNVCKGGFGVRGSGGGVDDGGGGLTSSTPSITKQLEVPNAPGILHGGTDEVLLVSKPPERIRSQSALLSGVNVTLTGDDDDATLSSGVPL